MTDQRMLAGAAIVGALALSILGESGCARVERTSDQTPVEEHPMAKPKRTQLALIETLGSVGIEHEYTVNGFRISGLISIRSEGGVAFEFATKMDEYVVLHPYFLRRGENRISASYHPNLSALEDSEQGPWSLAFRVALVTYPVAGEYGSRTYKDQAIAPFASPAMTRSDDPAKIRTLDGTFAWTAPVPDWTWTHGVRIPDSAKTRDSLYAAYVGFHDALAAMRDPSGARTADSAFIESTRASMKEFIQASGFRGMPFRFLDDVGYAATHLSTRDYDELEARRAAAPKQESPPDPGIPAATHDGTFEDDTKPGPDGKMPPRIRLEPLPPTDSVKLTVFAGGTLAKLTDADGGPLIQFISNYRGGRWGAELNVPALQAEVWYRLQADGSWAVDALWSDFGAGLPLEGQSLDHLLGDDLYWGAE